MEYIISIIIGYLFGCLNLAYMLSKKNKIDFQKSGTRNLGASNTTLHLGKKAGLLVAIHDIGKTIIAITIVKYIFGSENTILVYLTGAATVMGHIFPFWLHFKAGKGFASYIGLILSTMKLQYIVALILLCIVLIFVTDYIVSATFTCITTLPIYTIFATNNIIFTVIVLTTSIVIFIKHIENIKKIVNGEESHIKSTLLRKKE